MGHNRHRQLLALLGTLVLPAIAIFWLGWNELKYQGEKDRNREKEVLEAQANAFSANVQALLNRIKKQVLSVPPSLDRYSDPSVALVASVEGGTLVLPWESLEEPDPERYRRADQELQPVVDEATRLVWGAKQPAEAAKRLRLEIQKRHNPIQIAILKGRLRLALENDGRLKEAEEIALWMLKLPSHEVDSLQPPRPLWQIDAAESLIKKGKREAEVLARIEEDLDSPADLAQWHASLRDLLVSLRMRSRDSSIMERAETDLVTLEARVKRLEQLRRMPVAGALKASFHDLGVTPETWKPFPLDRGEWFVGMGTRDGHSMVVLVIADDIARGVDSDPKFQITVRNEFNTHRMGDSLPGWYAAASSQSRSGGDSTAGSVLRMSNQQWFYALSLGLILGLTFFGGHMLWRDTRRETQMAELRSQFVSSVSHELKTPLTGIRMLAETLQIPGMSDRHTQSEYLETIVSETERLTRLLNNVLDFSKIERGQKSYHLEPASLADVLQSAARTMRFPLAEQGFEFRMDVSGNVPLVRIDRDAIEQAVLNLISNAMKYSGESRAIDLRLSVEDGRTRIQVSDQGIGIPPEERTRIFEKFYRVQTQENRAVSGTGLGLALVAHIVEAHGGTVDVESTEGKGSTFTIDLPINPTLAAVSDSLNTGVRAYEQADRPRGAAS